MTAIRPFAAEDVCICIAPIPRSSRTIPGRQAHAKDFHEVALTGVPATGVNLHEVALRQHPSTGRVPFHGSEPSRDECPLTGVNLHEVPATGVNLHGLGPAAAGQNPVRRVTF